MNEKDKQRFTALVKKIAEHPRVSVLKSFRQHGNISTYQHCMDVAKTSYSLARFFHVHVNEHALVRGAFLHDYYLYDWHHSKTRFHGFRHPRIAMRNATRDFKISSLEADIIKSHMWPLTLTKVPHSKEAFLVCLADKICALRETLHLRRPNHFSAHLSQSSKDKAE